MEFLSLQCISAGVDTNEEDLYSYCEVSDRYSNYGLEHSIYSNISPLYENTSLPSPSYPMVSSSSSSSCSVMSDPEYSLPGMRYNVQTEEVSSDGPCPHQVAGCDWRGGERNLENHLSKNISIHLKMMVKHTRRQAEIISALQAKI